MANWAEEWWRKLADEVVLLRKYLDEHGEIERLTALKRSLAIDRDHWKDAAHRRQAEAVELFNKLHKARVCTYEDCGNLIPPKNRDLCRSCAALFRGRTLERPASVACAVHDQSPPPLPPPDPLDEVETLFKAMKLVIGTMTMESKGHTLEAERKLNEARALLDSTKKET